MGGLIVAIHWEEGLPYVGLVTVQPDGPDLTILWYPRPNRDVFPNHHLLRGAPTVRVAT
jgi:hypothetical protein